MVSKAELEGLRARLAAADRAATVEGWVRSKWFDPYGQHRYRPPRGVPPPTLKEVPREKKWTEGDTRNVCEALAKGVFVIITYGVFVIFILLACWSIATRRLLTGI